MKININRSPGSKIFAITCLIIAIIGIIAYYSNNTQDKTGEIAVIDNVVSPMPTENTIQEAIEIKPTQTPIQPTPTPKPYSYYYVNDNGYKSYLDTQYQDYLYEMCIKYNVTEYYTLFIAQMYHESSFIINNISKTHDYGLMQINKCNHKWLGSILGNNDFLDPYNNIEAGVYMMSNFLNKYQDVHKALVCYNRGEGAVKKGTYSTSYSRGVLEDMNLLVKID